MRDNRARVRLVKTRSDHDAVIAVRPTDVTATANVKATLSNDAAEGAVLAVLEEADSYGGLDLLGLCEWYRRRRPVERRLEALTSLRFHRAPGGTPVARDRVRFEHVATRPVFLAGLGRVDKSPGRRRILGPNIATLVILRDRVTRDEWAVIVYHLTAEVEHDQRDRNGDGYRDDRPLRVRRHKAERRRLNRVVRRQLRRHGANGKRRKVRALGDSNLDRMTIPGLVSAWVGNGDQPGTHGGRRKIDDVQAGGPA